MREIVGKVWPYILAGIAIGAGIHGYVPEDVHGLFHGPRRLVVGAAGGADRRADVHQRRRCDPDRAGPARQGRGTWHRARLHDERDRAVAAGNGDPAQCAEARLIATFIGVVATGILLVGYVFNLVL